MSSKPNIPGFAAGKEVRLGDGRVGKLEKQAKDTHVPAWYVKGIIGPVPTESLALVTPEVTA